MAVLIRMLKKLLIADSETTYIVSQITLTIRMFHSIFLPPMYAYYPIGQRLKVE
jgi:hypothetical protein